MNNWLWDRKISAEEVSDIFKNIENPKYIDLAALLLSRSGDPKFVFGQYLDKEEFCQKWPTIKKQMRKNSWNDPRIIFWQAIYEKLLENFTANGVVFRKAKKVAAHSICQEIGERLSKLRQEQQLSQSQLAEKVGVSQQMISLIEGGYDNMSILTIEKITNGLGTKLRLDF